MTKNEETEYTPSSLAKTAVPSEAASISFRKGIFRNGKFEADKSSDEETLEPNWTLNNPAKYSKVIGINEVIKEKEEESRGGGKVTEAEAKSAEDRVNANIRNSGNEGYDYATSPSFLQALSDDMKGAGPGDQYLTIKLDTEVTVDIEDAKILLNYYLGEPYLPKGEAPSGATEAPEAKEALTTEDLSLIQDQVDPKFLDPQKSPQKDDGDELISARELMELPAENAYGLSLLNSESEEYLDNQRQSNAYGMNQRVRSEGVFTPIIVREWADGTRSIYDGHHRLIAAFDNNPDFQVPVVIEKVDANFKDEFPSVEPKEVQTALKSNSYENLLKRFGIIGDFAKRIRSISFTNDETGEKESSPIVTYAGRPIVVVDVNGVDIPFYISTGSGGKENVPVGKWYPIFGLDKDTGWFNKGGSEDVIANYYNVPSLRSAAEWLDENVGDIRKSSKGVVPSIDKEAKTIYGKSPDPLALEAINKDVQGGPMGSNEALATRVQTIDKLMALDSPVEDAESSKAEIDSDWQVLPPKDYVVLDNEFRDLYVQLGFVVDSFLKEDLTKEEIGASRGLIAYQGMYYYDINRLLRGYDDDLPPDDKKEAVDIIDSLDDLFDKAPKIEKDIVVYRGIHSQYSDFLMRSYEVGDAFIDDAYISTSLNKELAREWADTVDADFEPTDDVKTPPKLLLEIVVPAGTRGVYVPGYLGGSADYDEEYEILLDRGTTFVVISKTEDPDGTVRTMRVAAVEQWRERLEKEKLPTKLSKQYFWETDYNFFIFNDAVLEGEVLPLIRTFVSEGQYEQAGIVAGRLLSSMLGALKTLSEGDRDIDVYNYQKIDQALKRAYDALNPSTTTNPNLFFSESDYAKKANLSNASRISMIEGYTKGFNSLVSKESMLKYAIGSTGRAPVVPENEKPISESSFDGIKSLTAAIESLANRESGNNRVHEGAAVDGGDIEDLYVRVNSVVSYLGGLANGPKRKIRLKFKLTAWAGRDQATAIESLDPANQDWLIERRIVIKNSTVLDNGDLVEKLSDPEIVQYATALEGTVLTYRNTIFASNGEQVDISFTRTAASDQLDITEDVNAGPRTLNNYVTIDLPVDATEEDITEALRVAGVRSPRAATEEDAKVVIENKLISIFGQGRAQNPSKPLSQGLRDQVLEDIYEEWGIGPEDVEISIDSSGFIAYKVPEEIASKIARKTNTATLHHMMSITSIRSYLRKTVNNFSAMSEEAKDELIIDMIADILFGANGESGLKSTINRYSEGKFVQGLSSTTDYKTGGADYVFLSPEKVGFSVNFSNAGNEYLRMHFDPEKAYRRLDFYANRIDSFGRRADNADVIENAYAGAYEVMFKHGMSMDNSFGVLLNHEYRSALLKIAKERNITEVAGIPIERFLTTRFYPELAKIEDNYEYHAKLLGKLTDNRQVGNFVRQVNLMDTINRAFRSPESTHDVFIDIAEELEIEGGFKERDVSEALIVGITPDLYAIVQDDLTKVLYKVGMLHPSYGQNRITKITDKKEAETILAGIINSVDKTIDDNNKFLYGASGDYDDFDFANSLDRLALDITPNIVTSDLFSNIRDIIRKHIMMIEAAHSVRRNGADQKYRQRQLAKFLTTLMTASSHRTVTISTLEKELLGLVGDFDLADEVKNWLANLGYTSGAS